MGVKWSRPGNPGFGVARYSWYRESMSQSPPTTNLRPFILFYIWHYIAIGVFYPFLSLYLAQAGFDRVKPVATNTPLIARIVTARAAKR